ncbi:MAG: ATPase P [Oscillospiraceae bacterium]|nr:ATPase P [Oscillospiraceae bacterium]
MLFAPRLIGTTALDAEALAEDKKNCRKYGPCGLGKKALYLGGRYFERSFYTVYSDIDRVFKRVAMSRGGFTGKGAFGAMAYLVVKFADGHEKQSYVKYEDQVDRLLEQFAIEHPGIPIHSEEAERKLREAEEAEQARYLKELTSEAESAVAELRAAQEKLKRRRDLTDALARAAKQKRTIDGTSPAYRFAAVAILLLGLAAAALGVYMLINHIKNAELLTVFGFAAIFLISSTRVLPTGRNNRRYAQEEWDRALANMRELLKEESGIPIPAQYAHPVVLERMIRVLREGRAQSVDEAYETMKADLKALNRDVTVSQKEYDEVVAVKPLFLLCGYADEI